MHQLFYENVDIALTPSMK